MPFFKRLAAEGAHTWEAYTIVPSITLPSHVSMLTGVGIQKHQVLWNDWTPSTPPLAVPTIFRFAKERGLGTAMIVSKSKFNTLGYSGFLDAYVTPEDYRAASIANAFVELLKTQRPNLCFIHFGDPDRAGHGYGVTSPEKKQALADCDAALRAVVDAVAAAGLADSSVFILTADPWRRRARRRHDPLDRVGQGSEARLHHHPPRRDLRHRRHHAVAAGLARAGELLGTPG
jgi:predicted AlkP superfamily pyrophosphatase or phosphodiesterase